MTEEKKLPKTLFELIRERIVPINAVIVLAGFIVAALDFLAPRAPYLQWLGWVLAAVVLGVMLIELIAPEQVEAWLKSSERGLPGIMTRLRMGYTPSMRSPAWQALAILAGTVFLLGQASAAKASTGGLLASQFSSVATLQASILGIREDLKDIKETLKNVKQETSSDPRKELMNLGIPWTEAGLEMAVENQDIKAIKLFVDSGFSPQKRNGIILGKTIYTKNDDLIFAIKMLNMSVRYFQPKGLTYFIDDKEKVKSYGCEYVVYEVSNLRFKISENSLNLIKQSCQKEMTSDFVIKQNQELKQWALKNQDDYWLGWANDVDKFNSLLR